jgi:excisionase family DNA binding protein
MESFETLLSIAQLKKLTGESESCWRKRLGRRELPYIRLGANVRVRRADLEAWLAERTVPRRERAS